MKPRLLVLSVLALLSSGCLPEKTAPGQVPSTFFYKGKPVDPFCFFDSAGQVGSGTVSLDVCTGKTKTPPAYNDSNFYGVTIEDMSGAMTSPYVYYKYLGPQGDNHVVQVVLSGGGTGQFSDVRVVSLEDNLMRYRSSVAGGDRCNGGIYEASMNGDTVSYSQNLTPFDLVTLSGGNLARFKAYDDIQACAACCVATADYEGTELKSVTLRQELNEIPSDLGQKDACFYGAYSDTYKKNRTLDPAGLKEFGRAFNERCSALK